MEYWKDGTVEWWSNAFYEASDKRMGEWENGKKGMKSRREMSRSLPILKK
jgi:hypothetical protein